MVEINIVQNMKIAEVIFKNMHNTFFYQDLE